MRFANGERLVTGTENLIEVKFSGQGQRGRHRTPTLC
jgi:hypothetical protein